MDITCGDCGARFHLDRALMKGSKAARLRCRKCGGIIVVRLREESPVPNPPPVPAAKEVAPKEDAFEADISGVVTSEPVPPAPDEEAEAIPPAHGMIESALEALPLPGEEAAPESIPVPPEENTAEETAATEPERKASFRRGPSLLNVLLLSVLALLLLAGGAYYFGGTKSMREGLGRLVTGWGSGRTGSAPEKPVYDIRDVKWYVYEGSTAGNLFVIKGSVANIGKAPGAGIRIQATLLGKDNEALAEKTAFAGNLLDEASLRKMDVAGIEAVLANRFGEGNVNREILTGKALPFMVVFTDPPGKIDSFMVKAIDVK